MSHILHYNANRTRRHTHEAILLEKDGVQQWFRFKVEEFEDKVTQLKKEGWLVC